MLQQLSQLVSGKESTEDVLIQVQQQYVQSLGYGQQQQRLPEASAASPPAEMLSLTRQVASLGKMRGEEEEAAPALKEVSPPADGRNCDRMVLWCQRNIVVYKYWAERYHWRHLAFTALHVLLNAVLAAIPTMEKLFPCDHYRYAAFAFGSLNTVILGLPWVKECRDKYSSFEEYQEALLDFVNQVNADPDRSFAKYRDDFLTRAKGPPLSQEQVRVGLAYFETWGRHANLVVPVFDSVQDASTLSITHV
ncbi:hypothetical protein DIPPA_00677 [Diplonema papillatum]|nr:hypothetical protein DIPPA_00677 [Diplonema papillatum]